MSILGIFAVVWASLLLPIAFVASLVVEDWDWDVAIVIAVLWPLLLPFAVVSLVGLIVATPFILASRAGRAVRARYIDAQ